MPYKNPHERRAAEKRYSARNKTRIATMHKAWMASHPGMDRVYARRWASKNQEKVKQRHLRYARSTKGIAKAKKHYENNKSKYRERFRRWYLKHPDYFANKAAKRRSVTSDARSETAIRVMLGNLRAKCYYCGRKITSKSIDHVVAIGSGGSHSPDNLSLACKRCNSSKGKKSLSEWVPPNGQPMLNL